MEPPFDFDRIDRRTNTITPALIQAVTDRIVERLEPSRVILFGSQTDGRATEDSDLDLLVILNNQHPFASLQHRFRIGKIFDLFYYRSFALDPMVLTEDEVQMLQETNEGEWDLVLEILATGKSLYERTRKTLSQRTYSSAYSGVVS